MNRSTSPTSPVLGVAEPLGDLALDVETQALLGPAGEEMHVAAHAQRKSSQRRKSRYSSRVIDAALDQFARRSRTR